MRLSLQALALALVFTLSLPSQGAAGGELVDAKNPQKLVEMIRDLGYRASLDADEVGDPLIRSSVGGTKFALVFYGCDEKTHEDCDFVLYKVGYDLEEGIELDLVNQWNATQLVGRAYRDDVNDPWLEMPWNLRGGVSRANFESTFEWWELSVDQFEDHIGF